MTRQVELELWLPRPREEVFAFFENAANLKILTPEWVGLEFVEPEPGKIQRGKRLSYQIKVKGFRVYWQSEITVWEPPSRFVDIQRRGPYKSWEHEHIFIEQNGGTLMRDRISYDVFGGVLIDKILVRKDLARIFEFRRAKMLELFGGGGDPN